MHISLLATDISARLLALIGVVSVAVFASAFAGVFGTPRSPGLLEWLLCAFIAFKTIEFAVPALFEKKMIAVQRRGANMAFNISTIVFLILCAQLVGKAEWLMNASDIGVYQWIFWAVLALACSAYFCAFASGIARSAYRSYFESEAYRHVLAQRAAVVVRQADAIDKHVLSLIFFLSVMPFLTMPFGKTIATPAHFAWEQDHAQLILIGVIALPVCGMCLSLWRGPIRRRDGKVSSRFMLTVVWFFAIGMAWVGWETAGKNRVVPLVANFVTDNPKANVAYRITDVSTPRRMGLCLTLSAEASPDVEVETCGHSKRYRDVLKEGRRVEFYGELGPFGHTLESFRTLP